MRVNRQAAAGTAIVWFVVMISTVGSAATCSLSGLGWMVADWRGTAANANTRERWNLAPSGALIGITWGANRIRRGDVVRLTAISSEQGRLVLRERHFDGALIHAGEGVDDPVTFVATSCGPASIAFEGRGRWAGGRLTYRRTGATLVVEGEVRDNGPAGHYQTILTRE